MGDDKVSRRRFLAAGGSGLGGAVVLSLGAARGAEDEEAPEFVALPMSKHEALKQVGGQAQAELPDGTQVLVMRVAADQFVCCSLKCTHNACNVRYDHEHQRIACPCHQSLFDLEGQPTAGPARRPLHIFETDLAVVVMAEE